MIDIEIYYDTAEEEARAGNLQAKLWALSDELGYDVSVSVGEAS